MDIVTYKTAYYSFYLPVACGLHLAGHGERRRVGDCRARLGQDGAVLPDTSASASVTRFVAAFCAQHAAHLSGQFHCIEQKMRPNMINRLVLSEQVSTTQFQCRMTI